ncbi:rod shape-determining protein MreC [Lactococcus garvieae]|uniref:rod shape-determining protein MreC n=1 Tax=Lactococcus garvieae TaxID=1363 RepID=UPI0009BEA7A3|nr:rod shape-determining protein MreC [Lactococcus garvieae]
MKKFNLSKMIIIALIIVISAFTAIFISADNFKNNKNPSAMTQIINDGTGAVDRIIGAPIRFVQDKANQVGNLLDTYKQNQALKTQVSELSDSKNNQESLEAENKELKAALKLQETLTDYKSISANVITRNPSSWADTLVIDSGSNQGIKNGQLVMANGGIVGRVSQANESSSKISLLSSEKGIEAKIPVRLGNTSDPVNGLLTSYDADQKAYVITSLVGTGNIEKGSQVFTSGLGGDSPRDLLLGTVLEVKETDQGLNRKVYVKPASSLYDIRFVFVIQGMIGGN